jgi:NAD(P)-dependent dehydrogenase (short-subunit alcohol dehydrogenase family)
MGMLDGKVAVVSGLGPGMGRDISLALAREGADIVMAARQERRMEKCAPEIEALGRRVLPVVCDITSADDCAALAERVRSEIGRLDILVNNAFADGDHQTFEDSSIDAWRATMDVNFFGTLQLTRALIPLLTEQDDSRVIMINTMSMQRIDPGMGAYAASKAALANATKTLAVELGSKGVRVNGVHPGYIWGRSVEWYFNHLAEQRGVTFQEVYDEIAGTTCLGYLPSSEEIAGTVLFFASPLSKPVTGQYLSVNAGHYLA